MYVQVRQCLYSPRNTRRLHLPVKIDAERAELPRFEIFLCSAGIGLDDPDGFRPDDAIARTLSQRSHEISRSGHRKRNPNGQQSLPTEAPFVERYGSLARSAGDAVWKAERYKQLPTAPWSSC